MERIRVKAFVLFVVLWSLVVYTPVAHWVWAPGGWLRARGVLDFAGGTVVHINAAAAAIVGALLLGKRRGLKTPTLLPHNVPFAILGAGHALVRLARLQRRQRARRQRPRRLRLRQHLLRPGRGGGGLGPRRALLLPRQDVGRRASPPARWPAWSPSRRPPASSRPPPALVIGALAGIASLLAVRFRPRLGLDDSLDVFAVHGVAATLGALLTGVLATKVVNPDGADGSLSPARVAGGGRRS